MACSVGGSEVADKYNAVCFTVTCHHAQDETQTATHLETLSKQLILHCKINGC